MIVHHYPKLPPYDINAFFEKSCFNVLTFPSHMITTNNEQHSTPLVFVQIPPGSISHGLDHSGSVQSWRVQHLKCKPHPMGSWFYSISSSQKTLEAALSSEEIVDILLLVNLITWKHHEACHELCSCQNCQIVPLGQQQHFQRGFSYAI